MQHRRHANPDDCTVQRRPIAHILTGFWLILEVANEKVGLCSKRAQYTENRLNLRLTWTGELLEPIGRVRRAQPQRPIIPEHLHFEQRLG